ncbi:MAG: PPOX class F420-dependent oxidoreductase [Actinobacteria bacterium]|nr:PPOX class F420-dependent oxidoreductase [Actinomycetota bacterium]
MAELSEKAQSLIDQPNFGYLATVNSDGSPQVSPVWVDRRDEHIVINTATGRAKDRNMRREPRIAISVANRENQYEKVDIRGRVVETIGGEEADQHIDLMAKKYMGQDTNPWRQPDEERVLFIIAPERIDEMG